MHHKVNISSVGEALGDDHIDIVYCPSEEQAADVFTKALAPLKWPAAMEMLGIRFCVPLDVNEPLFNEEGSNSEELESQ